MVSFLVFAVGAVVLGGCPIYSDNPGHRICVQSGQCYYCPNDYYTSDCYTYGCTTSSDCGSGYVCSSSNTCVSANPSGDCTISGCPTGQQCRLTGGALQCVPNGTYDGGGPYDATTPDGGQDSGDSAVPFTGCHNDAECSATTPGAKCLNGTCVAPADQCFDTTQCPNNEQCVQGVCTPSCATTACPVGFTCDSKTNVCSGNSSPCGATADGGTCGTGLACVEDHCVPQCGTGGTCPTGEVCVAGGCIPDQKPTFFCGTEGVMGAPCATGSVCIHHSCYIACNPDAGASACQAADKFNQCKPVTTGTGTYSVCGSSTNLGTECDPTQGKACPAAGVCIDGYCK